MATVTNKIIAFDDDLATLSYTYDSVTLLIDSAIVRNDSPVPWYGELRNASGAIQWSGLVVPLGQPSNPPATIAPGTYSIAALGLHMASVQEVTKNGTFTTLMPPFSVYGRWPA